MSLNRAVNQHLDNCANKQQPTGISPSSSYTFAIYNSASNNWSISPNNAIQLSKSPSPISSLTDGDSGSSSGTATTTGSGTGAVSSSWGSTKVSSSSSSGIGTATTTASTSCQQRSSVITSCSSASSSGAASTKYPRKTETKAVKSISISPTTPKSGRKTITFADDSAKTTTTRSSNDSTHGVIISGSSSIYYGCKNTVVVDSHAKMSSHQPNNNSSTIHTPTGPKTPSSPVKHSIGMSGGKSKSRHSSTSDSTCVTPTGSSSAGGIASAANNTVGTDGIDKEHSIRVTRKIFHNWRSACGRTKDKTKDFIRRWKTLPENQSECETGDSGGEQQHHSSSTYASSGGGNVTSHHHQPGGLLGNSGGSMDQSGGIGGGGGSTYTSVNNSNAAAAGASGAGTEPTFSMVPPTKPSSGFGKIRSLTKKFSQDIPSEEVSTSSISQNKPSAGWSVHVWAIPERHQYSLKDNRYCKSPCANTNSKETPLNSYSATYVQREQDDDDALSNKEEEKPGRDLLTEFQKTKLTHFFRHVLDMNHDDVISASDFVALNQRIRHYIEWSPECIEFHVLKEVHSGFLECFLNQPLDDCSVMYYCDREKETRDHVNLDEWLDVWGKLLETARTLDDLPLWLQYFPKIIFQVINKSGSQKISREELRAFYTMFLGIDFRVVNETLDSIYNAMTDTGRSPITYRLFKLCFANFLLGKYPHGPGQYMFGICSPQSLHCNFPIDYSALNTPTDDLKPYDPSKDRDHSRRSVIV